MAELLSVETRDGRGKHNARRMRKAGTTPAVLYGHGKETVSLAVPSEQLDAAIRHGVRVVTLSGAVSEQAFIRELQWDTFGARVLHVDFARVYEHEMVEVTVAVELRGEAPGVKEGGVIQHLVHEVTLECEVTLIPEKLYASVNGLKLGDSILLSAIELPPRSKLLADPEAVVVQCVQPAAEIEEEAAAPAEGVEPELIGRKAEETEEAEE